MTKPAAVPGSLPAELTSVSRAPAKSCAWFAADEDQLTGTGPDGGSALVGRCRLRGAANEDGLRRPGGMGWKRRSIPFDLQLRCSLVRVVCCC
jgi:hypothetical protein